MKAKPFIHRVPIAPVQAMKNGYRLTSPPAVYDPNATVGYTGPQRFLYTNGVAMSPQSVPFNGQVHLLVS